MKTVVSGVRPTGRIHLGNYFGAMRNFVRMQHEYDCYFFIADYHSLTTHPNPESLRTNNYHILAHYLAAGLDPEKAVIYTQSDVPETAELYLFLNMNAYLGELSRCTSFKEKARQNPDNVNAGLLTYPTLMAADILLHRADFVPVGKDQEQHLEMTRTFAQRFNHVYKTEFFKEPQAFNFGEALVKVPGLDGKGKMGKSEGEMNAIYLTDPDEVIRKKVMKAVTDSGPTEPNQVWGITKIGFNCSGSFPRRKPIRSLTNNTTNAKSATGTSRNNWPKTPSALSRRCGNESTRCWPMRIY